MFFIDKYTPKTLDEFIFHKEEIKFLETMSKDASIPHLIFSGSEGSGKKTLIRMFMEMLFDKDVHKVSETIYKVYGNNNQITEVKVKQGNYHIVIEPNNNNFDRYLIQDIVKEYAKKVPLNVFATHKSFKIVFINNADNMSFYGQTSLRRTMEKYSRTCRFIMCCKSLSKIIDPIRSRCNCRKIRSPSDGEILELIAKIAFVEHIKLNFGDYCYILKKSNSNVKTALFMLQLKQLGETYDTSYDLILVKIIDNLLVSDPKKILETRKLLYDIMITNIPSTDIIKYIVKHLMTTPKLNEKCKLNIVEICAKYEHHLVKGRREINHLDAFIIGIMYIINKHNLGGNNQLVNPENQT